MEQLLENTNGLHALMDELFTMLYEVRKNYPGENRAYYINAVYSRFIDEHKQAEHDIRTTVCYSLIANCLNLLIY